MNAIIGMTELVLESRLASDQREYLMNVMEAGESLLSIINDILDLSKIEADKTTLEFIETPLIDLLSEVARILRTSASGKGVMLNAKLVTPVPDRIMCDPTRLRQILMNLVGNAVKFTEAGSITISVRVEAAFENASLAAKRVARYRTPRPRSRAARVLKTINSSLPKIFSGNRSG
jgi:protein-histidine pros-kinase